MFSCEFYWETFFIDHLCATVSEKFRKIPKPTNPRWSSTFSKAAGFSVGFKPAILLKRSLIVCFPGDFVKTL